MKSSPLPFLDASNQIVFGILRSHIIILLIIRTIDWLHLSSEDAVTPSSYHRGGGSQHVVSSLPALIDMCDIQLYVPFSYQYISECFVVISKQRFQLHCIQYITFM